MAKVEVRAKAAGDDSVSQEQYQGKNFSQMSVSSKVDKYPSEEHNVIGKFGEKLGHPKSQSQTVKGICLAGGMGSMPTLLRVGLCVR